MKLLYLSFQTMMNRIFSPLIDDFLLVYLNDLLLHSQSTPDHLQHLRKVFQLCRKGCLHLKKMCVYGKIGHLLWSCHFYRWFKNRCR